jgi:hypothetical protein
MYNILKYCAMHDLQVGLWAAEFGTDAACCCESVICYDAVGLMIPELS